MATQRSDVSEGAVRQSNTKTLLGTGVGNALEWFDWNIYASFAVYFSTQLFNSEDPQSAFLETMAVFAVGFVARPFGGFVFGWIGDRIGRKHSLTLSVLAASAGSLIIAICPTYDQIGWVASALLVLARLLQGLAHGGELPAAQTYLAEQAPREKRGLYASSIYVTGTIGLLVGLGLGLVLNAVLTSEQMDSFGWRIPFAVGALLGLFALWIRSSMEESEVFELHQVEVAKTQQVKRNVFVEVAQNWRTGLTVIGMTMGLTVAYYIWSVTMASLAQTTWGYSSNDAFTASLIGNFVLIVVLPFWGALSDRIGRKPCMLIATIGSAVLFIPLMLLVAGGQLWQLVFAISIQLFLLAGTLSHAPATYAEMFPTSQRTAGFGIPYAIAIAAFGGTAGYVLTWIGDPMKFAIYAIVLLVLTAATIAFVLPESRGKDLTQA
ncbi:MHS family alpha-ketoglutarate permease-like MFS transporter [Brevibacterium sanguinis]|uniref:MHS family alpha-ketoglutarate permease-like MFS transporter n=2 Tax=Brevibacterium TaxID=1696 RepID=A0ABX9GTV3_9MICO|nr:MULTISPECIES: MFS transporter [Brevibacterium]RBP68009.1 MHS family alpha-ketoglutarate permease-like MFS transporter [Brevibacterium sanguinis]RBP74574.1 MHS family alpha-ketoglutarate permease-like MFS transporter [Brevibacterium celere]